MSDQPINDAGATVNNQVLLALGELKGQMLSISAFLQGHSERMDRQDKRQDDIEETVEGNRTAASAALKEATDKHEERIRKVELKMAYWAGALALAVFLIEIVSHLDIIKVH